MRWPKISAISRKSKVESEKFSTVENRPKINRGFELQNFRETVTETTENLNENLNENKVQNPCLYFQNFRNMSKIINNF